MIDRERRHTNPFKFGRLDEAGEETQHVYPHVWMRRQTGGPERLVIGAGAEQVTLCRWLAELLPEPYWVLYVLTVARGGSEEGRYQSRKMLSREELKLFLGEFRQFLERDARHQIWIAAWDGSGQVVYDQNNLIYAYGPLERMEGLLNSAGLLEVDDIELPPSHTHHCHACFDVQERELLTARAWTRSDLRVGDEE